MSPAANIPRSLSKIRLGCVPESFSCPVYRLIDASHDIQLVTCPGGTGEMIKMLQSNQLDIAICLTEGLVAKLVNDEVEKKSGVVPDPTIGSFKIVGTYVDTPLTWSIATHPDRKDRGSGWEELKAAKIGVSRPGSGSHIIPYVIADKMGWLQDSNEPFEFVTLKNIDGLVEGVLTKNVDAFLWERFTTKPYYDSGVLHHMSNITPPWPAFMLAASANMLSSEEKRHHTHSILKRLETYSESFSNPLNRTEAVEYIQEKFKYKRDDIASWLDTVAYPKNHYTLDATVVKNCVEVLSKAGVIQRNDLKIEEIMDGIYGSTDV